MVTANTIPPKVPAHFETKSRKASGLSFSLVLVITGTKAWAKAPSAKRRLKKLGIRFAKKNTSEDSPAPNTEAITISRTIPSIREAKVIPEVTMPDLRSFALAIFSSFNNWCT